MKIIKINNEDTVAVALEVLKKGEIIRVNSDEIMLIDDIPSGHKIALKDFTIGEGVIKYGEICGKAKRSIRKGEWIHTHNLVADTSGHKYIYQFDTKSIDIGKTERTFMGYGRDNGEVGIRNYIAIIPTVFCVNGPARKLAQMLTLKYPNTNFFDGFQVLDHSSGCSQTGDDLEMTSKTLANVAKNANFGGVLFMSLGCEINDLKQMSKYIGDYDSRRVKFMKLQDIDDEYDGGMKLCKEIYDVVSEDTREPFNLNRLSISYNCGGSDGFSGITANRIVGLVNNKLIQCGATTNITEVPEMLGAEHILANRAKDRVIFSKIINMINTYKDYFSKYGQTPESNPTQGNKEGGLTTLADKSLGCIQKGGKSIVMDVVACGDRIKKRGFNLVVGPGNDLAGITAQVAAGSVLTVFTTGRGTPCGFIGPTFRVATNNQLYNRKPMWNDFNAGRMLDGESAEKLADELFEDIIATCEGRYQTMNERNGFYSIGIFKDGVLD
ncbi:altronate dehydratase family protein [Megasphaera paucivorans]|uniref:Altronate hydrolase n=1 Tax=Megasphaera paucivorans TaxID=349095 RepID=A0A1H0C4Y4_9FIRM|nr:altronate dehydratase family protein [Megasphaera paucivorans]SDN52928.1 altronate hydrolase [Megasphaera paucivorans]